MKYKKPGLYYTNGAASACADGSSATTDASCHAGGTDTGQCADGSSAVLYTEPGGACAPTGVSAVSLYGPGGAGCADGMSAGAPIFGSIMCDKGTSPSSTSCGNGHDPTP